MLKALSPVIEPVLENVTEALGLDGLLYKADVISGILGEHLSKYTGRRLTLYPHHNYCLSGHHN